MPHHRKVITYVIVAKKNKDMYEEKNYLVVGIVIKVNQSFEQVGPVGAGRVDKSRVGWE